MPAEEVTFILNFVLPHLSSEALVELAHRAVQAAPSGVLVELRMHLESRVVKESRVDVGVAENDDNDQNDQGSDSSRSSNEEEVGECYNADDGDHNETPQRQSQRNREARRRPCRPLEPKRNRLDAVVQGAASIKKPKVAKTLDHSGSDLDGFVPLIIKAFESARQSLEWHMIVGPWIERVLGSLSDSELHERLELLETELSVASATQGLAGAAFQERLMRLNTFSIRFLRSASGMNKSTKDEIVHALATQYTQYTHDTNRSANDAITRAQSVIPTLETRKLLKSDPEAVLTQLQFATKESSDQSRIISCARDAHIAWIWEDLGETNAQVAETLNDWFDTKHTQGTWLNRRRTGQLLLEFPSLAYQSVLPLDNHCGVSPFQIAEAIRSLIPLNQLNAQLIEDFEAILVQPASDKTNKVDDKGQLHDLYDLDLHVDGFKVLTGAVNVSREMLQYFQGVKKDAFHPIFNNGGAENDDNDLLRLQVDYNKLQGRMPRSLRDQLVSLLQKECPGHSIRGMAVLRSEPGCLPQIPHTDYAEVLVESPWYDWTTDQVPLGCVVALQDGTVFDVWPGAIRFKFEGHTFCHQQLVLNRGDVVVFRGDLVHAGAGFDRSNVRVHCYLEPNDGGFPRPKESDGTEITELMSNQPNILPRGSVIVRETWV